MTTYDAHVAALRHESAALADAARRGLDAAVPSCPEWTVAALLGHVGHGFRAVAKIVRDHADAEDGPRGTDPPANGAVEWFEESVAELVEAFANEPPDAPCWNWSGSDETALFWARRMAHEVAVHRWDAEAAYGTPSPIDAGRAVDGVTEALEVFLPASLSRRPVDGLDGTFAIVATDTGDVWTGVMRPDSSESAHAPAGGAAAAAEAAEAAAASGAGLLRGRASDLLLALWGRSVPVEVTGDPAITGVLTE